MVAVTTEQKILLALIKSAICGGEVPAVPEDTDWKALFQEAYTQAVPMLFFDIASGQMPEQVYQKSFQLTRQCTAHNLRTEHTQAMLVSVLDEGAHPYVIIKGEASAAYYPKPELRLLGDVDFLLQDGHAPAVIEKMKQLGFTHSCKETPYHQILHRGREQIELHFEVAGIPQGKAGAAAREYLATVFDQRQTAAGSGGAYCVPCGAHHGLILMLHMQHHLQSHGMGLRHIMDWACFVQRTAGEPFWQEHLLPILHRIGLYRYCAVMTKLCALYLGTVCPAWAAEAPEELCRDLMEDLMAGGNFGCKDKERARSTNMLPDWTEEDIPVSKLSLLLRTLRQSVLNTCPELAEKPVRLGLFMVLKVLRYCALYCVGRRPNIWKAAAKADQRRSVYDRLEMFVTEK